jgi:hypothetical protein
MASGNCLYGGRKLPEAPPTFTVDTSVSCFLFGQEHYLCRYLDLIVAKGGGSVRGFIKALLRRILGQIFEEDIDTAAFCGLGVPTLPEDINYLDVFGCFSGLGCDTLLEKITGFYHYSKWYEYCECIPTPPPTPPDPDWTPFPPDPNGDPIYPPNPPIPPGACSAYWASVTRYFYENVQESRVWLAARKAAAAAQGRTFVVRYERIPPDEGIWERSFPPLYSDWGQPPSDVENPCNCLIQRVYAIVPHITSLTPGGYVSGDYEELFSTYYLSVSIRFWQGGCEDSTGDRGWERPLFPPEGDLYPDFPWLRKRKRPKGGASCGCCGSQWSKNKSVVYLPSRYKI